MPVKKEQSEIEPLNKEDFHEVIDQIVDEFTIQKTSQETEPAGFCNGRK